MRRSPARTPRLGTDARYRLVRQISEDQVGSVWAGEDMALGRVVTIRVIAESLRSDDRFTELLASTTERLLHPVLIDGALRPPISHPNAARVFYFDLGSGTSPAFVVMEELEGEPLATLLSREGRLDAEVAVRITIAVARAVHAAHEAGLVHGAVNPANLLIDSARVVKVFDFGAAAAYGPLLADLDTELSLYLAPELLAGEEPTSRSDTFAVGAVLYAMLAGVPSGEGGLGGTEPIRRVFGDAPGGIARLCSRALAQDPHARPASLEDFASRLSEATGLTKGKGAGREPAGEPVHRPGPSNEKGKGEIEKGKGDVPVPPRRGSEMATKFPDPEWVEASLRKLVRDREESDEAADGPVADGPDEVRADE